MFYRIGYIISRCLYEYRKGRADGAGLAMNKRLAPVVRELKLGHLVEAIKQHRAIFGSGLKEAHDICREMQAKLEKMK